MLGFVQQQITPSLDLQVMIPCPPFMVYNKKIQLHSGANVLIMSLESSLLLDQVTTAIKTQVSLHQKYGQQTYKHSEQLKPDFHQHKFPKVSLSIPQVPASILRRGIAYYVRRLQSIVWEVNMLKWKSAKVRTRHLSRLLAELLRSISTKLLRIISLGQRIILKIGKLVPWRLKEVLLATFCLWKTTDKVPLLTQR